ncbi:MAG TPA: LCP family protein [Nocardioidaceae bacterium]|nr:LCP family protein [Nocardioidaceae bacterium]
MSQSASRRTPAGAPSRRASAQERSARIRFRRALMLLLMTLVVPGSAQLVAGSSRLGRAALRVWFSLVGFAALLALLVWIWPGIASSLAFSPLALGLLRVLLTTLALGWAALFIDAWRLGDPLGLRQRQRLAVFSINSALCVVVSGALLFGSHLVGVQRSFVVEVFGSQLVSEADNGRFNVLLLGGDAGETRWGMRPDSITVASVDARTGRTVLFGLPRNLQNVPFPEGTPMHEAFPDGYDCGDACLLNAIYTWAVDHKDKFDPDIDDVGVYATTKAVEATTGLKINYYAMVDMRGFEDLVDAVGGVDITVPQRLPIGGGGGPILGWIEPGRQHLNGHQALWFARSRATTDDYSRMARQKCVLNAMLSELSPATVVTRFQAIAEAGKQIVTTDIPASELDTFVELARRAKELPMASVSFVPPRVETADPDFDAIHEMVDDAIARAEQADEEAPDDAEKAGHRAPRRPGSAAGSPPPAEQANRTADLTMSCG